MIIKPIATAIANSRQELTYGKSCFYGASPPQKVGKTFVLVSETSHKPNKRINPLRRSEIQVYTKGLSFRSAEEIAALVEAMPGSSYDVDGLTFRIISITRLNGPVRLPGGAFSMNFTVNSTISTTTT
jgi:hypothetical protein